MILGVTGSFGCGKTTAARMIAERGFRLIDADALIREQVMPLPAVVGALRERYGDRVVGDDGSVNRSALGDIVFKDDSELHCLEELTHPHYYRIARQQLASAPGDNWVLEVPLLFEKSLENWFDFTVCVACDRVTQLARLEQRGLSRTLAEQRISKQLPLARKIELSDLVLWNDGSTDFLRAQVDRIVDSLIRPEAGAPLTENPDVPSSKDRRRNLST
jgi:dephospho-CoA kinase